MSIDFEKFVGKYIELRDKIKSLDDTHKETMKPYREALDTLNNMLLGHLNEVKTDSAKTANGTVYKTVKKSASLEDPDAFMKYVIDNNAWDLMDRKANAVAVEDFIKANQTTPPGVKFTTRHEVGVRRS